MMEIHPANQPAEFAFADAVGSVGRFLGVVLLSTFAVLRILVSLLIDTLMVLVRQLQALAVNPEARRAFFEGYQVLSTFCVSSFRLLRALLIRALTNLVDTMNGS
jgi:hypothetical protein